jgi:hypothetical protein
VAQLGAQRALLDIRAVAVALARHDQRADFVDFAPEGDYRFAVDLHVEPVTRAQQTKMLLGISLSEHPGQIRAVQTVSAEDAVQTVSGFHRHGQKSAGRIGDQVVRHRFGCHFGRKDRGQYWQGFPGRRICHRIGCQFCGMGSRKCYMQRAESLGMDNLDGLVALRRREKQNRH